MYTKILTKDQLELLSLIKAFREDFYLAGGTAIALYLGHRRSIDFDLFCRENIKRKSIKNIIAKHGFSDAQILFEDSEQLHLLIKSVKLTFFHFPYPVQAPVKFEHVIALPNLLDLAAMKAYALGGRGKWKDYVDLYFLLNDHFTLQQISNHARHIFATLFNEKLFRQQLCYFHDIDFSETIEYAGIEVDNETIQTYLTEIAVTPF